MHPLNDELELATAVILASEDWAKDFSLAPVQHAAMIKNAAKMQRFVLQHFSDLNRLTNSFIDWYAYSLAVNEQRSALKADANIQAYDVNVVVHQDQLDQNDQQFIKLVFDTVANTISLGSDSMEEQYGIPIGLTDTSTIIQNLTSDQLANLVGMKVDKDTGLITPNPNPAMSIDETTRSRIVQSIKTSIQLGENQREAAARLENIILDSDRADMIAYTETVRAYAEGRSAYASQSNATGKYWSDSNAIDICSDNTAEGTIPIDADFVSGDPYEPAHPNCKCITTYVYGDVQFDS